MSNEEEQEEDEEDRGRGAATFSSSLVANRRLLQKLPKNCQKLKKCVSLPASIYQVSFRSKAEMVIEQDQKNRRGYFYESVGGVYYTLGTFINYVDKVFLGLFFI